MHWKWITYRQGAHFTISPNYFRKSLNAKKTTVQVQVERSKPQQTSLSVLGRDLDRYVY